MLVVTVVNQMAEGRVEKKKLAFVQSRAEMRSKTVHSNTGHMLVGCGAGASSFLSEAS